MDLIRHFRLNKEIAMEGAFNLNPITRAKLNEQQALLEDKTRAEAVWQEYVCKHFNWVHATHYVVSLFITCLFVWFSPSLYEYVYSLFGVNVSVTFAFMLLLRIIAIFVGVCGLLGIRVFLECNLYPDFAKTYPEIAGLLELRLQ